MTKWQNNEGRKGEAGADPVAHVASCPASNTRQQSASNRSRRAHRRSPPVERQWTTDNSSQGSTRLWTLVRVVSPVNEVSPEASVRDRISLPGRSGARCARRLAALMHAGRPKFTPVGGKRDLYGTFSFRDAGGTHDVDRSRRSGDCPESCATHPSAIDVCHCITHERLIRWEHRFAVVP
ncbi:hypothetical protein EVAR_37257_1 [Eumeta japonica]|uniref:Uncharacterized protein n=1 Tax=Eumeta variegata TaxID=151549 RepID=A0A4C1WJJ6_EUMVA|nr:hypothetical protein EVAR_37257_1 [Eumeta japonica]